MNVREIEAQLARDVEHRVLQNLGYAEWEVTLPRATVPLDPRPQVRQLDPHEAARVAEVLVGNGTPGNTGADVYWLVKVPRTVLAADVRTYGLWQLRHNSTPDIVTRARPINITPTDATWNVYLGNVNDAP